MPYILLQTQWSCFEHFSSHRHGKTVQALRGADSICAVEQGQMMQDAAAPWLAWRQLGAECRHALSDLSSWTHHPTLMAAGNSKIPLHVSGELGDSLMLGLRMPSSSS